MLTGVILADPLDFVDEAFPNLLVAGRGAIARATRL